MKHSMKAAVLNNSHFDTHMSMRLSTILCLDRSDNCTCILLLSMTGSCNGSSFCYTLIMFIIYNHYYMFMFHDYYIICSIAYEILTLIYRMYINIKLRQIEVLIKSKLCNMQLLTLYIPRSKYISFTAPYTFAPKFHLLILFTLYLLSLIFLNLCQILSNPSTGLPYIFKSLSIIFG